MENSEDFLLDLFKNQQSELETFLKDKFCIEELKFCCSKDTYGPECSPCKKENFTSICSNNGNCNVSLIIQQS